MSLWISKILFSVGLEKSPSSVRCGESVDNLDIAFFQYRVLGPLCRFLVDIMFRKLCANFFVLEASFVYRNVVPPLCKTEHNVFF